MYDSDILLLEKSVLCSDANLPETYLWLFFFFFGITI